MISNSFDPEKSAGFIRRFQKLEADFASEKGRLMQALKEDKETVLEQAEAEGIPKKILKLELDRRKADAKFQERLDRLDTDEEDQFDLFASAVARGMGEADDEPETFTSIGEAAETVVNKAADAVMVNKGKKDQKAKPDDDGQTDIEDAAKAATERDMANADAETERFMGSSTNQRVAETAE